MKKNVIFIVLGFIIFIGLGTASIFAYQQLYKKGSLKWYQQKIKVEEANDIGEGVKTITCGTDCSIYNKNYQKVVDQKVHKLSDKDYSLENALWFYNPYGTNTTSMNVYFTTSDASSIRYKIHVEDETIADYSNILYNEGENNLTKYHSYQIIGFIPGMENEVTLEVLDEEGQVVDSETFHFQMPDIKSDVDIKVQVTDGDSTEELTNGLYSVLGHDKNFNSNIYLYDNNGVLRAELPLQSYRTDRILWIDDMMVYNYKKNGFVFVNRLGKIEKTYQIGNYEMHHDFEYDEKENKLLILASLKDSGTIEDRIISLDLDTGEVEEVLDMKDYFKEAYESASKVKIKNAYGTDDIDWIHLNSIDLVGDDLILSSRELSAIIRMNDIYTEPKIEYTIADQTVFEGTEIESKNYTKVGDFVAQAGQHSVTYIEDDSLEDGVYYLILYNNNYNTADSRPDFDWSAYPGTGTYSEGEKSMYYKYLVNEQDKTFELVDSIDLPYSSIVSSVEHLDDNIITSSGKSNCYEEFDQDRNLIRSYHYSAEKYAYRVFKYPFTNYWFYENE